jgi:hypothetical protein
LTRVTGPMFSLTASGTIGDVITYSNWKGLAYVRSRVIPSNPQTDAQTSIRNTMTGGVSAWRDDASVPAASRSSWDYYASGTGMSGFNRYIKKFIETNTQQTTPWTNVSPS